MKYKPKCKKLSFPSKQEAWERVVYERRKGMKWKTVYLCRDCYTFHLTSEKGGIPNAVKLKAGTPSKKVRKELKRRAEFNQALSLAEQREALKKIDNQPYRPWWKKLMHTLKK